MGKTYGTIQSTSTCLACVYRQTRENAKGKRSTKCFGTLGFTAFGAMPSPGQGMHTITFQGRPMTGGRPIDLSAHYILSITAYI